jgi:aryl-alcohol dehydrogenase-like predicted oxidoreductase
MANKIGRREFLVRGIGSLAGLTLAGTFTRSAMGAIFDARNTSGDLGLVSLGRSGIVTSPLAFGTGSVTRADGSNQVRLGQETFTRILRHCYDRGIRFVDTAESYGSIPFVGKAIAGLPREELTILTKIWTQPDGSGREENVRAKIEEYLRLFGTDHLDVLLMHCMMQGDWDTTRTHYMEGLSRAKEEGLVRAVGVSCHNLEALRLAALHPWVEVIMARINPWGTAMDGPPDEVKEILHIARENGKGLVGMKIFGEGRHVTEPERERSIRFGFREAGLHAMTIGLESTAQVDDAVSRVARLSTN